MNTSVFPDSIWDGTSPNKPSPLIKRIPELDDWQQAIAEIKAIETFLFGSSPANGSLVSKGFVLGATGAIVTGTNILPPFTVPGSTAVLNQIKIIAGTTGSLTLTINIGAYSKQIQLGQLYTNLNISLTGGTSITVDVNVSDGNARNVTVEMEFLAK